MNNVNPSKDLCLDMLKKILSYSLWPEQGEPVERFNYKPPKSKAPLEEIN